ncbi:MAG: serine/threonine-protein kinase [Myxococcales bacterium]|nr:protein kinase [Myxococcota bacterium]MDW8280844.1 serine/threonine-protein kinase [Myxococcales bacterium]
MPASSAGPFSPPPGGPPVGDILGDYLLLRRLASGGMAEVFLARRCSVLPGFAKLVAIKRMLPHLAEDPEFIALFLNEARTASHLNHPNIVQIFDVGEAHGTLFLAMEYLEGISVMRLIQHAIDLRTEVGAGEDRMLSPLVAAGIGVQVCQGLHHAHELQLQGQPMELVHRDVSPQNLILTFGGVVKLLDFGIAKAAGQSSATRAGVFRGKLRYMAPEQLRWARVDRRTDVYSLGVVLYELATATRAFCGEDWDIVRQIQQGCLPPAHHVRPAVPAPLSRVIARAMAVQPEDRYPTAAALGEALLEVMRELGQVITSVDLAHLIQQHFAAERLDLTPYLSGEHLVPRQTEACSIAAAPARAVPVSAPGEWALAPAGGTVGGGAVGSAPQAPPLGLVLTALLWLRSPCMPRGFWLYPVLVLLALTAAVIAMVGRVAPRPVAAPLPPPAPSVRSAVPAPIEVAQRVPSAPPSARSRGGAVRVHRPRAVGFLVIDSLPSPSRVYVGGHLLGQTPLVKRPLAVGWTTLRIVNVQTRAQRFIRVHIRKGETTTALVRWNQSHP